MESMAESLNHELIAQLQSLLQGVESLQALDQQRRAKLAQIFPASWLWECDAQGKLRYCDDQVEGLLGYSPQDLVGQSLHSAGLSPAAVEDMLAALDQEGAISRDGLQALHQSGQERSVSIIAFRQGGKSSQDVRYWGLIQVGQTPAQRSEPTPTSGQEIPSSETPFVAVAYEDDGRVLHPLPPTSPGDLPEEPEIKDGRLRIPIRWGGRTLGILEFDARPNGEPWDENDRALASELSEHLALAIQDAMAYQLMQQALEELRHVDQLKSQFLANMSHELRTPLNSIIGFSRVILKGIDGPLTEQQEQDLQAIHQAGQHLLGLINDILDLSKIEAGKMELSLSEVDLAEILRAVLSTAEGLIKDKPIELWLDLPPELPKVRADSIRVRQIVLNLVSNAAKFTDQGRIGISARTRIHQGMEEIVINVSDTGRGISAEDQAKLFQPFAQVEAPSTRTAGGTGLGLSICRHLVELHGGSIWVESEPGKGSTFSFSLPVRPVEADERSQPPPPQVAVVAHSEQSGDSLLQLARRAKVSAAYVPPGSLEATIASAPPKLLVVDPSIPDEQLWHSITDLKERPQTRWIPVLPVTFLPDGKGLDLGVADILTKPLRAEDAQYLARRFPQLKKGNLLIIDHQEQDAKRLKEWFSPHVRGAVRLAHSALGGLMEARKQSPDLFILNLFMPRADGFRMMDAILVDERTRGRPVVLLLPPALTPTQIQQLAVWVDHCRQDLAVEGEELKRKVLAAFKGLETA